MQPPKKLMKSRTDKVIDGVCAGLGEYFGIDPVLIRLAFVVGLIAHAGSVGILYIVLMVIMPEEDQPAALRGPFATGSTVSGSGASGSSAMPDASSGDPSMPGAASPAGESGGFADDGGDGLDARLQEAGRRIETQMQAVGSNVERAWERDPQRGRQWAAGILIFLGLYFLVDQFGLIPGLDLGRLWPLLLVFIGIQMLRRRNEMS